MRLVDACYSDYFKAVTQEISDKALTLPEFAGSFGITWEEWAAHLAGPTRNFREASRLLIHGQAAYAIQTLTGNADPKTKSALDQALQACLRFAEHDFGGVDLRTAAISAGVRAGAAMEARTITQSLSPVHICSPASLSGDIVIEDAIFDWRGWKVHFDRDRNSIVSLLDTNNHEWIAQTNWMGLGTFWHALYPDEQLRKTVLPQSLDHESSFELHDFTCRRADSGVEIKVSSSQWGFRVDTRWFFHSDQPWIDIVYDLSDGWSDDAQTVQICFPFSLANPVYTYDMAGTVLQAGSIQAGGDDLPGANPVLHAMQNYAQISSEADGAARSVILLSPDAPLVQFGISPANMGGVNFGSVPSAMISMPMMNLTRTDWSFNQGGENGWQYRYRLILTDHLSTDPVLRKLLPFKEAQYFAVPPFLQVPGTPPVIAQMADLNINFEGGPVTAFKCAEDGERLILRVWNILDHPVMGTVDLPQAYQSAEITDALERRLGHVAVIEGVVMFTAPADSLLTLAFVK